MAQRESDNTPHVVNRFGMMGKYQFDPRTVKVLGFNISKNQFLRNPELRIGDRIVCLEMDDEPKYFGAKGTVIGINQGPRFTQYNVNWDDGGSLFLLDTDSWILEKDFKRKPRINEETNVNESGIIKNKIFTFAPEDKVFYSNKATILYN